MFGLTLWLFRVVVYFMLVLVACFMECTFTCYLVVLDVLVLYLRYDCFGDMCYLFLFCGWVISFICGCVWLFVFGYVLVLLQLMFNSNVSL